MASENAIAKAEAWHRDVQATDDQDTMLTMTNVFLREIFDAVSSADVIEARHARRINDILNDTQSGVKHITAADRFNLIRKVSLKVNGQAKKGGFVQLQKISIDDYLTENDWESEIHRIAHRSIS